MLTAAKLAWPSQTLVHLPRVALTMSADASDLLCGVDGNDFTFALYADVLKVLDDGETEHKVVGAETESEALQPGSHSGIVRLSLADSAAPRNVFLKKITAKHAPMVQRPWADRRRTLAYARTEARFYQEFASDEDIAARLAQLGVRLPRLGLSENSLDAVLGDSAVHEPAGDEPSAEVQAGAGAVLFLEKAEGYVQASPLNELQIHQALRAVASFHASFWEDESTLRRAASRLQRHGGVYALEIRSAAELLKLKPNWDAFMSEFRSSAPEVFERPGVAALGERLERWTQFASKQVSPSPADRFATLVHGDYKAMNVMLPPDASDAALPPMLIDFASTGVGLGMCDVAMLLAHSVRPSTLADGGLERLLGVYLDALHQKGVAEYDLPTATRHFHLATVDYARFVVSRFWSGASADAFAKRAQNPNICLPNRDVEAAIGFVERIDASLTVLDGGGGTCC